MDLMEARPPSRRRTMQAGERDVLPWQQVPSIPAGMLSLPVLVSPIATSLSRMTPLSSPLSSLGGTISPHEDRRQFLSNLLEAALLAAQDSRLPCMDEDGDGEDVGSEGAGGEDAAQDDRRDPDEVLPKRQ
jgi:hypothetical protein